MDATLQIDLRRDSAALRQCCGGRDFHALLPERKLIARVSWEVELHSSGRKEELHHSGRKMELHIAHRENMYALRYVESNFELRRVKL